jgi:hypothetical protein
MWLRRYRWGWGLCGNWLKVISRGASLKLPTIDIAHYLPYCLGFASTLTNDMLYEVLQTRKQVLGLEPDLDFT